MQIARLKHSPSNHPALIYIILSDTKKLLYFINDAFYKNRNPIKKRREKVVVVLMTILTREDTTSTFIVE
jgi:hypothetical protein